MTIRQRLTWQHTFFKRVISLSTARWFFSLVNERGEESALPMVSSLSSASCKYEDSWRKILVVSEWWKSSQRMGSLPVGGRLLAKGPDSSFGGGMLLR